MANLNAQIVSLNQRGNLVACSLQPLQADVVTSRKLAEVEPCLVAGWTLCTQHLERALISDDQSIKPVA